MMDTTALGQTFLTALQISHQLLFHFCSYSFVCSPGIKEWERQRPEFEETYFLSLIKLKNKKSNVGSEK